MKKKEEKQTPVYKKIEFDETTNEPIIVEISADSLEEEARVSEQLNKAKAKKEKIDEKPVKHLVVNKLLGFNDDENINKRQKFLKTLFVVLFVVFVVGVLAFTFYNDFFSASESREEFTWEAFGDILSTSWQYLIFALLSLLMCFVLKGLKLSLTCKNLSGKLHFWTCLKTGIVGHYYNSVTPLAVGGQPFEIYHLSKHGVHGGTATSLPVATYFLNQLAYVIIGITALVVFKNNGLGMGQNFGGVLYSAVSVLAIIGLCFCMVMPLLIIMFLMFPRACAKIVHFVMHLGEKLKIVKHPKETTYNTLKTVVHTTKCMKKIATSPLLLISCFLLSLLENIALCSISYFTLKFFGFDIVGVGVMSEWIQVIFICTILYNAISFIPTPGNSGAADLSFYALFQTNLMVGLAFPAMATWRILSFYSFIVIGFIYNAIDKKLSARKLDADIEKID